MRLESVVTRRREVHRRGFLLARGFVQADSATYRWGLLEGRHQALGQWIGRTSCNRTLNFSHGADDGTDLVGRYLSVRVTRAGPNSLVGESVTVV